jgi:hypothetical protein
MLHGDYSLVNEVPFYGLGKPFGLVRSVLRAKLNNIDSEVSRKFGEKAKLITILDTI